MTKTEQNKFKQILDAKQTELGRLLRNREGIAIEKNADALDEVQQAAERELAIRNLDRESGLLRQVKGAMARLEDGSYGICMHCEEEINPETVGRCPVGSISASSARNWPTPAAPTPKAKKSSTAS